MDPVVGDDECKILDVCQILEALESYTIIIAKLNEIGLKLRVPSDPLNQIEARLTLRLTTPFVALNDILAAWRSKFSFNAKLSVFLDILEKCGIVDASDALKERFHIHGNSDLKKYVSPPEGVLQFQKADHNVLVIRTRDKNMTVSKLKDTTTCIHSGESLEFAKFFQNDNSGKVCSFECSDDFNLTDVLNFVPAGSKCKIIIITEERLDDVEKTCANFRNVMLVKDILTWSQLSPSCQISLTEKYVKISGSRLTLKEFTRAVGRLEDGMLDEAALLDLINDKEPHLDKSTVPERILYYIPRRISPRSFLNSESLFKMKGNDDIVMFSGIDCYQLSKYARSKLTDSSTNQRRIPNPTVTHMVLDLATDFDEISKKHKGSTHWIMHDKGKFYWVRSAGKIDVIRKFIEPKKAQPEYTEDNFLNFIRTNSGHKTPVVISDTPGMGKTQLLGRLATLLISQGEIVLFGVLPHMLKALTLRLKEEMEMKTAVADILSSLGEQSIPVANFLRVIILNGRYQINVMLDGFDEINSVDIELAKAVLETINSFQQVRLWITTRPHYLEILEDWLQVLGHNLQPFNPQDQLNCLIQYWNRKSIKQQQEFMLDEIRLKDIAKTCLDSLHTCMKDKDHDIAGVPLQCMLIGEVFTQEALNYANSKNVHSREKPPSINIRSITDLYSRLVEKKLDMYRDRYRSSKYLYTRPQLRLAHMLLSIQLLFPGWENKMKTFLETEYQVVVDIQAILNVGLMEKLGADEKVNFIHRTIAEYFTAEFAVNQLGERVQEKSATEFLSNVLATQKYETSIEVGRGTLTSANAHISSFIFTHSEVVYFIDNLIQPQTPTLLSNGDVATLMAHSCVTGNFVSLFNHFDSAKLFEEHKHIVFDNNLVLSSVRYSDLSVIQNVCEMYENTHETIVRDISTPLLQMIRQIGKGKVQFTLLHIAVKYREFLVVQFLIHSLGFVDLLTENHSCIQDVVSICVEGSLNDDASLIGEKIFTLRKLHEVTPQLFGYKPSDLGMRPALFCGKVDISVLLELISLKSTTIVPGMVRYNILLHASEYLTADDFHKLVSHVPPSDLLFLLKSEASESETTIMYLMSRRHFELCPQTIHLFKRVGLDFNYVNECGNSVLHCAIKGHKGFTTYGELIECGAIVCPGDKSKWTLLHTALAENNFLAFQYFSEKFTEDESTMQLLRTAKNWCEFETLDVGKLGIDLNIINSEGNVILHCLSWQHFLEKDLLKLLLHWGADINAKQNGKGCTVLEERLNILDRFKVDSLFQLGGVENVELLESHGAIYNQSLARKVLQILDDHEEDNAARRLALKIRSKWESQVSPVEVPITKNPFKKFRKQ